MLTEVDVMHLPYSKTNLTRNELTLIRIYLKQKQKEIFTFTPIQIPVAFYGLRIHLCQDKVILTITCSLVLCYLTLKTISLNLLVY